MRLRKRHQKGSAGVAFSPGQARRCWARSRSAASCRDSASSRRSRRPRAAPQWAKPSISAKATAILTAIRDHEIAHRDFFKAALKKNAIPALDVDFTKIDFNSRDSVLTTAKTFEDLGVAAYNGAGQLLEKGEYLLLAGKIVSVEARHATAIRYLIGMKGTASAKAGNSGTTTGSGNGGNNNVFDDADAVNDKGLDRAQKPSEVLATAGPFIKTPITADDIG